MEKIILTIPYALPTLNAIRKMHYQEYKRLREKLAWEICGQYRHKGDPIKYSIIFVTRHGSGKTPDWVNLYGSFKALEDCLVMPSKANPSGLGIIYDDNPEYVKTLTVLPQKCKRGEEKTVVEIVDIGNWKGEAGV